MAEQVNVSSDWIKNWQTSIAVKITGTVLYAMVFIGFVIAVFSLRNIEKNLEKKYAEDADRMAFQVAMAVYGDSNVSPRELDATVRKSLDLFDFSAVEVSVGGPAAMIGERALDAEAITRTIPAVRRARSGNQGTILLKAYYPPVHKTVIARRNMFFLMTGGAALAFGFFLTWVILRFISNPIRQLVHATRVVAGGDLTVRLDTGRQDEFGGLSRFFNHMLDQILNEFTERKEAEEQLRRSLGELELSNEEIRSFAYIVSHDLRAPLVNIKGFSGELRQSLPAVGPVLTACLARKGERERERLTGVFQNDVPQALGFIESSVNKMEGLINAVSRLARIGRTELKLEPVDTEAMVREVVEAHARQLAQNNVTVTVDALPGVVADKTAMKQIIGNIIDNAIKYVDPHRAGRVFITGEQASLETTIHIHDNGRGMSREDVPKAFEFFRRVGTAVVPGAGMGLAYAKALVRRHGGRIWCESEPGKGTIFSFTVPRFDENTKKTTRTEGAELWKIPGM